MAVSRARAATAEVSSARASTGVRGLDEILAGGLPRDRLYLVDGEPGTGKTPLALQFLLEGAARGERGLYVTLSETAEELHAAADSHGWSLAGIELFEFSAAEGDDPEEAYTLFHPAEVELQQTVGTVLEAVKRHRPARAVFDSLSEMRLLARDPLRFRRQILALKQYFVGRECTALLLDDRTGPEGDLQLQSLAHGVVALEHLAMEYGAERRRLQVKKLRGVPFRGGYHDFRICTGGLEVFPRLLHGVSVVDEYQGELASGSGALDALLGGGVSQSTSTLITGAAGTGKTALCTQYAQAALARGERVRFYLFDERVATFRLRAAGLGFDVADAIGAGRLVLRQVEPTELSPGEFASEVMRAVTEDGIRLVVIDSINGYLQSMPAERLLAVQLHELLSSLATRGVTTFMTLVQRGVFGGPVEAAVDVSYLADTVILLRYFEFGGAVRQAISIVKKRTGDHEHTIREYRIERGGLRVGEPLHEFRGVLTGVPEYTGPPAPLMGGAADPRAADERG